MKRTVSLDARRELCMALAERYRAADRPSKKLILDEFVKVTGYHRKHAIRILRKQKRKPLIKDIGKRTYEAAIEEGPDRFVGSSSKLCCQR